MSHEEAAVHVQLEGDEMLPTVQLLLAGARRRNESPEVIDYLAALERGLFHLESDPALAAIH